MISQDAACETGPTTKKDLIGSISRSADQPRKHIYIGAGVQWIKARGVTTHSPAVEYYACVEFRGLSAPRGSDTGGAFRALDPAGLTILWGLCGHGKTDPAHGPAGAGAGRYSGNSRYHPSRAWLDHEHLPDPQDLWPQRHHPDEEQPAHKAADHADRHVFGSDSHPGQRVRPDQENR